MPTSRYFPTRHRAGTAQVGQESIGTDQQRVGTEQQGIGTDRQSIGSDQQNVVTLPQSVGTVPQNVRTEQQSVGTEEKSIGTKQQSSGTEQQSVATIHQRVGTEQQSVATEPQSGGTEPQSVGTEPQSVETEPQSVGTEQQSVETVPQSAGTDQPIIGTNQQGVGTEQQSIGTEQQSVGNEQQRVKTDGKVTQMEFDKFMDQLTSLTLSGHSLSEVCSVIATGRAHILDVGVTNPTQPLLVNEQGQPLIATASRTTLNEELTVPTGENNVMKEEGDKMPVFVNSAQEGAVCQANPNRYASSPSSYENTADKPSKTRTNNYIATLCEPNPEENGLPIDYEQREHDKESILPNSNGKVDNYRRHALMVICQSKRQTCNICFEVVHSKEHDKSRNFGLLENCNHAFCADCIYAWRRSGHVSHDVRKSCPVCRMTSNVTYTSRYWTDVELLKGFLVAKIKAQCSKKHCRYFKRGRGICPFGDTCFFKHTTPNGDVFHLGPALFENVEDARELMRSMYEF